MQDWNVVVTVHEHGFKRTCEALCVFGPVGKTDYFNVLTMKVADVGEFLEAVRAAVEQDASLLNYVARVLPVTSTFGFQSPEEFERKVQDAVEPWLPELAGRRFHVRMHRRGFKGRLSSQDEERFLDHFLLERLEQEDSAGTIDFDDPDVIVALETLGQRGGVSRWPREQRMRYPFLRLD